MTQEQHFDVAAYALGVLDEHDAARFEDHLIDCPTCAIELESLLPVVDILADVDADALVATEQSRRDGMLLKAMIGEVKQERKQANSRRLYSLAAAVVVFAMLSIGALFAGATWFAPDNKTPSALTTKQAGSGSLDPLPPPNGVGGPDLPGKRYGNTDPRTQVRLDAGLEPKDMGTQVSFAVGNISGPLTCRLIAIATDGHSEPLQSWTVGVKGWGTVAHPEPLLLQTTTALSVDQIASIRVEGTGPDGTTKTLVQVPQ